MTCKTCNGNQFTKNSKNLIITCPDCCDPAFDEQQDTSTVSIRALVLDEAKRVITQDRAEEYGDASENFKDIADMWSTYLDHTLVEADVAAMMALMKIVRLKSNHTHRDSWVDIAGYSAIGAEVAG